MQVSIIRADNKVTIDGETHDVGCGALPAHVHAIQWDGEHGEIEYVTMRIGTDTHKLPNQPITDFAPFQGFVDAWKAQKELAEAEAKRAAAEAELARQQAEAQKNVAG